MASWPNHQKIQNLLYREGVRKGDRVGLYCANRPGFIYTYMAVISLGAIIIPINNSLVDREVDFILKDSVSKLVVSDVPLTVSCRVIDLHDYDYEAKDGPLEEAPPFPSIPDRRRRSRPRLHLRHDRKPEGCHADAQEPYFQRGTVHQTGHLHAGRQGPRILPMFHCYGLTTVVNSSRTIIPRSSSCVLRAGLKS